MATPRIGLAVLRSSPVLILLLGNAFGAGVAIVVTGFLLLPNLFLYARLFARVKPAGKELPETI